MVCVGLMPVEPAWTELGGGCLQSNSGDKRHFDDAVKWLLATFKKDFRIGWTFSSHSDASLKKATDSDLGHS